MPVGHSLTGMVNLEDGEGRRRKGTVALGGLPNLRWSLDREGGFATTPFTQIYPAGDVICQEMTIELEAALDCLKEQKRQRR